MAAENNMTISSDFAKVQSIDFVNQFNGSIKKLLEALGITRKIPMASGTLIKTYKTEKDIKTGAVGEGETIPLSKVKQVLDKTYEITFQKYRKAVSAEAIQKSGFSLAVSDTDATLLREIQKRIRADLFTFLASGTGAATAENLQGALAKAWGGVQTIFEDDGVNTVAFVNPNDVADYLGHANVTTQNVFGMTFITGFTGVTVITNSNVPAGKVYATAPENLVCAYVEISGGEIGKAFDFTLDETGYVGVTHTSKTDTLTCETVALSGVKLFAERTDGIVVVTIEAPAPSTGA